VADDAHACEIDPPGDRGRDRCADPGSPWLGARVASRGSGAAGGGAADRATIASLPAYARKPPTTATPNETAATSGTLGGSELSDP
jgi:hypothetical protein